MFQKFATKFIGPKNQLVYENRNLNCQKTHNKGILEKNIVLLGETDLTLESVLQKRKLNEHNYLNILIDISWWLMELHGENKGWKVFYAAIEPSKIGLVEINGNYHAYIMNYKMAQG